VTTETLTHTHPRRRIDQPDMHRRLDELISDCGGDTTSTESRYIHDLLATSLKLITDDRGTGDLKLLTRSMKELRHAMRVFAEYRESPKVSIFGSARTPAGHPDYVAAHDFAAIMRTAGWLCITGAGDGIMRAGHEGSGRDAAFGLAIRLPFETTANHVIVDDVKLLHFRYFFTRKTMFMSQSDAVVAFPGGFGTLDEVMECLTLVQTGKSSMVPLVLIEGFDSDYWDHWEHYVVHELLGGGFISPDDTNLYYRAASPADAAAHVQRFYANYHSSRYVRDDYVIRIKHRLSTAQLAALNDEFSHLVAAGSIRQCGAYDVEGEYLDLARIAFTHTRRRYGTVRRLIDRINDFYLADVDLERP
jgi:uncharacterized protein (TIGR00730 family)